jgi:hypothetical protein
MMVRATYVYKNIQAHSLHHIHWHQPSFTFSMSQDGPRFIPFSYQRVYQHRAFTLIRNGISNRNDRKDA